MPVLFLLRGIMSRLILLIKQIECFKLIYFWMFLWLFTARIDIQHHICLYHCQNEYKPTHHKAQSHQWLSFIQVIQKGSSICVPVQGPAHRMLHSAWPPLLLINCPHLKKKERQSYQQAEDSFRSIHTYSFLTDTDHVQVYYERLKVVLGYYDNTPCYN